MEQKTYGLLNCVFLSLAQLTHLTFSLTHVKYSFFELLPLKLNNVYKIAHSIIISFIKLSPESFIESFIEWFIEPFTVLFNESCISSITQPFNESLIDPCADSMFES